jgi:5-(carboxyamino)imidazole ribonucleotide mutase
MAATVGIVMGSASDLEVMRPAKDVLEEFGVECEVRVISAHRTPTDAFAYAETAVDRGLRIIIAGAGGAAHLAGVLAASTPLPVIGVPVPLKQLDGLDSLLSTVQMPAGVPVATVAVGGAKNAGLLALRMMGAYDADIRAKMLAFQAELAERVRAADAEVQAKL